MLEEMENNCLLLNEEDRERDRGPQSADSALPLVLTLCVILGKVLSLWVLVPYDHN